MESSIISIQKLWHKYQKHWAVQDINLEVKSTGIYGLLGSNGAGKSTLMNILCGVIAPTSGTVLIKDFNIRQEPIAAKRLIGFLPQQPPLLKELTVREFLLHAANLRFIPKDQIKNKIESALQKCRLVDYQNRLIKNLSGGYQQRVGIAQAIIHEPAFVVLDEPTNGLDPVQILEIRKLIKEIAEERTVLLSTHILQEVQALCDTIWLLNHGKLVFSGTLTEFNGSLTSNVFEVVWLRNPDIDVLESIPGVIKVETTEQIVSKIHTTGETDTIERIMELSVQNKWGLIQFSPEKRSLESAFSEYAHSA